MPNFEILNELTDIIFITGEDGRITFENDAGRRVFGKIRSFSKIKNFFEADVCLLRDIDESFIDLINESPQNFYSRCRFQRSETEYLYFDVFAAPYDSGKFIIFKDITESLKYEGLKSSYEKLKTGYSNLQKSFEKDAELKSKAQRAAIETALINRIFARIRRTQDKDKIIPTVAGEIHELLGGYKTYYAACGRGSNCRVKFVLPNSYEEDVGKCTNFDDKTMNDMKAHKISSSVCLRENAGDKPLIKGTYRVVIPITDGKKTIGAVVCLTTKKDVLTENSELLQTLSAQMAGVIIRTELTDNLKNRNKKLQKTLKELEETKLQLINSEKLASVGQLVAGVAHEINTPLASISSNNGIMKKLAESGKLSENEETIKLLTETDGEAVKRISGIVKSLKKFVRLDEAELQPADINKELDLTLTLIRHETKNKVEIVRNYGELPQINCFVNMLNQVFMNLLVNACQSIKDKGVIEITTKNLKNAVSISIKDNGSGISEKNKENIFKAGFTTKGIGIGTGLGLAISKNIVEKHGGKISFKSTEGKGTEFIIKIPRK